MKRVISVLALVGLAYMATACSRGPNHGTIVDRAHHDAYSYWVAGIQMPETCTPIVVGKTETEDCTPGIFIPGHEQYVPQSWELKLDDGKHVGWHDVDEAAYAVCLNQDYYPACVQNAN